MPGSELDPLWISGIEVGDKIVKEIDWTEISLLKQCHDYDNILKSETTK